MPDELEPMPFDDQAEDAIPLDDDDLVIAEEVGDDLSAIDLEETEGDQSSGAAIQAFGAKNRHEDQWTRKPNVTGQGAIHVRTFHTKLREDAIEYLDKQINEWLDAHPEYEVKFANTTIGELKGKMVEPALFVNVWV